MELDHHTSLLLAVAALSSAIVVLWRYTEARMQASAETYRREAQMMQQQHREEIQALVQRLDLAEAGRLADAQQHGHELRALAERSIQAYHEASQTMRSLATAVHRIPCQNRALTPMEPPTET